MRKRKSPIALVSFLAVVVCGVVAYSFATGQPATNPANTPPPSEAPTDAPKAIGAPRSAESKEDVAKGVQSLMSHKSAPTRGDEAPGRPPSGPMILAPVRPTGKMEKPKPNTSSTSTQWYNDESALSKDKG